MSSKQELREVKALQKGSNPILSAMFKVIVFICLCFLAYGLISDQLEISTLKSKSTELEQQYAAVQQQNEALDYYAKEENLDEYIDKTARERLDYARPDERVYHIVPEN